MRPKLPSAERVVPYLKTLDSSRIYSNFGPLVAAFEDRLTARFGLPGGTITTVANGTIGLTLTLAALGARPGLALRDAGLDLRRLGARRDDGGAHPVLR